MLVSKIPLKEELFAIRAATYHDISKLTDPIDRLTAVLWVYGFPLNGVVHAFTRVGDHNRPDGKVNLLVSWYKQQISYEKADRNRSR